jgi:hypothetical protein
MAKDQVDEAEVRRIATQVRERCAMTKAEVEVRPLGSMKEG